MRVKGVLQRSIYEIFATHELGQELKIISEWLDGHAEILDWVEADLQKEGIKDSGGRGMSVESVLRCAILKQYWQWTYEELEYHLIDSDSTYGFARLGKRHGFSDYSARDHQPDTLGDVERINQRFGIAMVAEHESLHRARIDSTVTRTHIHAPSDATLLADGMRLFDRLVEQKREEGVVIDWSSHSRMVKKRVNEIRCAKGEDKRKEGYRKLLKVVKDSAKRFRSITHPHDGKWKAEAERVLGLMGKVIGQTERRVMKSEKVPVQDKIVSLFEEHSAIIVKDGRKRNTDTSSTSLQDVPASS